MREAPGEPEVGDIVVIGLYWGGHVGQVVSTFAVELLSLQSRDDDGRQRTASDLARLKEMCGERPFDFFVSRVVEFRSCWFSTQGVSSDPYKSPLLTSLAELPVELADEVQSLLQTEVSIGVDMAKHGTGRYIEIPGGGPN